LASSENFCRVDIQCTEFIADGFECRAGQGS
jgi:hypothetical protein